MKTFKESQIDEIAEEIKKGNIVSFATETVYGLGVIYDSKEAFDKLVSIKRRPPDKPFSMMVSDLKELDKYAYINDIERKLILKYMPGEITILFKAKPMDEWITLGTNVIGIRIPNSDFVRKLIRKVGKPMLVTSANRSGEKTITEFEEVIKTFSNEDLSVVEGKCVSNLPSTIVSAFDKIKVLRVGSISEADIEKTAEENLSMRIAIGCDHGGFDLKNKLKDYLIGNAHDVIDCGTYSKESCNYPIFGEKVGRLVSEREVRFGIVVCTTGEGICMSANKVPGVRCGIAYNDDVTRLMRQHNDANVISFGAKFVSEEDAIRRLNIFLITEFEGGRHETRVNLLNDIK